VEGGNLPAFGIYYQKLSHGAKSGENFRCFGNPFGLAQDLVDALDGEHC
jgi:hypothetical protein